MAIKARHRELRRGNERAWWQGYGIAPLDVAAALWEKTHALATAGNSLDELDGTINGARLS
jgi:hypothetical protein